jgi:hypothetical protein
MLSRDGHAGDRHERGATMGWDRKARGRKGGYYYRSVRVPGRPGPVKVYLGTGSAAQAEAAEVAARRKDRSAAQAEAAAMATLDGPARGLADACEATANAALAAGGLHGHHGTWRRAGNSKEGVLTKTKQTKAARRQARKKMKPVNAKPWGWMNDAERRRTLGWFTRDAENGVEGAREKLRLFIQHYPEFLSEAGALADRAERAYAEAAGMGDLAAVEAARREAETMRIDLGGDTATGVEKLLIDQVVMCRLAERHAQLLAAEGASFAVEAARMRRAEATGRRYLAALRLLALVRALAGGRRPAGAATRDG